MQRIADLIPGYSYGDAAVSASPVSMTELEQLKRTVGWSPDDPRLLEMAGEVLRDQVRSVVEHWRGRIIASIPHLARHSRDIHGDKLPDYLGRSNLRFEQWILDTCFRPYDQAWLDYQNEIAVRHMAARKNMTDHVQSTAYVPLRDVIAFTAVMNDTILPYLRAKGHGLAEVERMHSAWRKSLQLQLALWTKPYMSRQVADQW